MNWRKLFVEYKLEFVFGGVLIACVCLSLWMARFIPIEMYQDLSLVMNSSIIVECLFGAWIMSRHINGVITRKAWVFTLLTYAFFSTLLLFNIISFVDKPERGLISLESWEMVAGNFLLWLFFLYPTLVLRPGWMTFPKALLQGVPVWVAYALDKLFAIDLRFLIALYPVLLLGFLVAYIRKYRQWCEENYSSMDNIDVQWIVRYIIMYLLDSILFFNMCFFATAPLAFTQQWLILLMIAYSTEQILYRGDPWKTIKQNKMNQQEEMEEEMEVPTASYAEYRIILEEWMEKERPYKNSEFRLMDLRQILPLNRTYLSQFINTEYGCNFYQFVTNYRIEEAKRLMQENPDMKFQEIADECGFSSPTLFSRIFARETGMTPREWTVQVEKQGPPPPYTSLRLVKDDV